MDSKCCEISSYISDVNKDKWDSEAREQRRIRSRDLPTSSLNPDFVYFRLEHAIFDSRCQERPLKSIPVFIPDFYRSCII